MKSPEINQFKDNLELDHQSDGGLELAVDGTLVDGLDKLGKSIFSDQSVTSEHLVDLAQRLDSSQVKINGIAMTIGEIKKDLPMKRNREIWQEIKSGIFNNTSELTYITQDILEILIRYNALYLGSALYLDGLTSVAGLKFPETIHGSLHLSGLTSAKDLMLPEIIIDGDLFLNNLTSTDGLVLPNTVGGSLILNGLTSSKDLVLPNDVKGGVYLEKLTLADKEILRNKYPKLSIR